MQVLSRHVRLFDRPFDTASSLARVALGLTLASALLYLVLEQFPPLPRNLLQWDTLYAPLHLYLKNLCLDLVPLTFVAWCVACLVGLVREAFRALLRGHRPGA